MAPDDQAGQQFRGIYLLLSKMLERGSSSIPSCSDDAFGFRV